MARQAGRDIKHPVPLSRSGVSKYPYHDLGIDSPLFDSCLDCFEVGSTPRDKDSEAGLVRAFFGLEAECIEDPELLWAPPILHATLNRE